MFKLINKKNLSPLFVFIYFILPTPTTLILCNNQSNQKLKKHIILIEPWYWTQRGGLGINNFNQAIQFNKYNDYRFTVLFSQGTISEKFFQKTHLPYETFKTINLETHYIISPETERTELLLAYQKDKFDIVISPRYEDMQMLIQLKKEIPIKIVFVRHASVAQDKTYDLRILAGLDAFAGGNDEITEWVKQANITNELQIKHISTITPFWDEDMCINFTTTENRLEYFQRRFNIALNNAPILCTIANLYDPCKNHPLLFQAIRTLIYEKNTPLYAMIAGEGPLRKTLEKMVNEMQIQDYVHFLGTIPDIQALLYHCDMHVFPSYHESFPLANLEAAAMKKPIIMASNISASQFIINNHTGLLFKNRDADDLINKIEFLLQHPQEGANLGKNAYKQAKKLYSNKAIYLLWHQFLDQIIS